MILFIGLALVGALFLGPRFQESKASSTASALVQQVSQVVAARSMYRLRERKEPTSYQTTALAPLYLKSVPVNPTGAGFTYSALDVDGNWAGASGTGKPAYLVIAGIGGDAQSVASVSSTINRQTRGSASAASINDMTDVTGTVRCVSPTRMISVAGPGYYVAQRT